MSPWLWLLFDHVLRFHFPFPIHLNFSEAFHITSDSIGLYPSMQWWSANVARFPSLLFPLSQFVPFCFSFSNPEFGLANHAWFVSWVCRSDWYCKFRSIMGDADLRVLAFCVIWFLLMETGARTCVAIVLELRSD